MQEKFVFFRERRQSVVFFSQNRRGNVEFVIQDKP